MYSLQQQPVVLFKDGWVGENKLHLSTEMKSSATSSNSILSFPLNILRLRKSHIQASWLAILALLFFNDETQSLSGQPSSVVNCEELLSLSIRSYSFPLSNTCSTKLAVYYQGLGIGLVLYNYRSKRTQLQHNSTLLGENQ